MKRLFLLLIFCCGCLSGLWAQSFRFAHVSDTHINTHNPSAEEDLRRTVADINSQPNIAFVLLTGDITEMGTDAEIKLAKAILSDLRMPYYILPGNHDTGWSESGGVSFIREFGYDKFAFEHQGFKFIGTASGPYVRMSDGHIPRDAVVWLDSVLAATPKTQPLVFVNHYPIDNSLDNWFEITDRLKPFNIKFALCGHGHANRALQFEYIPATMGRSNLRVKDPVGGYNLVDLDPQQVVFREKRPGQAEGKIWREINLSLPLDKAKTFPRPDLSINNKYPQVKSEWTYHAAANVVSTPAVVGDLVIFGNSVGEIEALSLKTGKKIWSFRTGGAVYSSPAVKGNKVFFGSGDGQIYGLDARSGQLLWSQKTGAAVLGSPVIQGNTLFIGSSDHSFRALDLNNGKQLWSFNEVEGAIVGKALLYQDKVIFGAWDTHLYALDSKTGKLSWKWNNGLSNRMFSPAMVTPVGANRAVFIAAPDRFLSAIDVRTGETLWRSNEATVRESIGLSADGKTVYGKTMNDEFVAFNTSRSYSDISWKLNAGFGYEHVPSMLMENKGVVAFGTKNGTVYAINPKTQKLLWAHKLDNSMVNTVNFFGKDRLIAATMDGKVALISFKN